MTATAPAKVILFGEHAVVYGQPAIAVPVSSLRARAEVIPNVDRSGLHIESADLGHVLPVEIDSELVDDALAITARRVLRELDVPPPDVTIRVQSSVPMASGLGSGAAVSTAVARAIAEATHTRLNKDTLNAIVYEIEKLYHGTPSGIDNTVIVYEKPVYFIRGEPITLLQVGQPMTLVIGDTGEPSLTKFAVGDVRKLYDKDPAAAQQIIDAIGSIAHEARTGIARGDVDTLGELMRENHRLLQQLTVSAPSLDKLVDAATRAGAVGAKMSGGGRGGNMIALVTPETSESVCDALIAAGAARTIITEVRPHDHRG